MDNIVKIDNISIGHGSPLVLISGPCVIENYETTCTIASLADAHKTVLKNADMVTLAKGPNGAVREACEAILKAQGLWENTLERFL